MLLYLDRSDERKGIFFFHEERGRVISLCDMMMWVLDNFSPTLMDCLICLYLCIYLSLFSYSSVKYHSTLTDSEYRQLMHFSWIAVCILTLLPRPLPLPPSPRLLLRFAEAKYILTMYYDLQGRFLGCLLFYPFTEINLLVKASICLTTVPLMKLIYLPVLILNKCLKAKTLGSLNSWWTLSIDRQCSS